MSLTTLLRFFFPPICIACEQYAEYFCKNCQNKIDFLYYQPQLSNTTEYIDSLSVLGFFTSPLSKVIKALKYQSLWPIGALLGNLLYKHAMLPADIDIITAVPLHPKRFRERGYNQAELIAQALAQKLHKPYATLLVRQKHTQNLASAQSDQQRLTLMRNAFILHPTRTHSIAGKNILIIDDVVTTGATLAACARALKHAGAGRVTAAALAHEG